MKQTAVEWLEKEIFRNYKFLLQKVDCSRLQESIEKAKEMETQQQDEYAIEFTEWCNDNYFRMGNTNIWLESKDFEIPIKYTTKELLETFKNK